MVFDHACNLILPNYYTSMANIAVFHSPEDQLILEAFYKENPKPNKAARAEILKDVKGMNEKEIQVSNWNRMRIVLA